MLKGTGLNMAKKSTNKEPLKIKFGEFPEGMKVEDFPGETQFILDDHDEMSEDSFWVDE